MMRSASHTPHGVRQIDQRVPARGLNHGHHHPLDLATRTTLTHRAIARPHLTSQAPILNQITAFSGSDAYLSLTCRRLTKHDAETYLDEVFGVVSIGLEPLVEPVCHA